MECKKKKKSDNLIFICLGSGLLFLAALIGIIFLLVKSGSGANRAANLGERQNQQTQSAVLQLASNLLDNANNLNQLTRKSDGTARTIQEIEEDFLISAFQPGQSPVGGIGGGSLPPEIIERIWWELRPWIEEYLKDLNRPILEHARGKFRRDVENWLRWQSKEYNRQLEKYQKLFQELKRIEDLIREYQKIRERELLDKISRKKELISKGYVDRDVEQLKEWGLLDQEIPDLTAKKRIGATNILYTNGKEPNRIGGSCDLIIFLKPNNNQEATINFTIDLGEYKDYYKQIIRNFLTEKGKNNDVYVLIRDLTSARGDSAGIAFYLTLHSLVNQIPLPSNLGSTGTVYGTKTGAIGGLNRKLEYNVKKENPINIFILSEENKNNEPRFNQNGQHVTHKYPQWDAWENIDFPPLYKEKVNQIHFTRSTSQIETALAEILKEPDRHIIHSCSIKTPRKPDKPEEPNPNSSITPEKMLSLAVEVFSRNISDSLLKDRTDLKRKLMGTVLRNENYNKAVEDALELRKKVLQKLSEAEKNNAPIDKVKELDELNKLETKIVDFFSKLEKVHNQEDNLIKSDEQVIEEIISAVKKNEWIPEDFKDSCTKKNPDENYFWIDFVQAQNYPFPGHEHSDEKETVRDNFDLARKKVKEQSEKRGSKEEKKLIRQGYEDSFKIIASTTSTTEILTELEKIGYTFTEIEWTGKLHAPSLNGEPSVGFLLAKK